MRNTRKIFAIIVLCFTVIFALAACGSGDSDKSASGSGGDKAGKRVYLAAPLFSKAELDYNLEITKLLEDYGYKVFLPQRDGFLAPELEGKSEEQLTKMIFEKDREEVLKSDILVMILDGRVPDEGACVELGFAYENNKRCYGLKTDPRATEKNLELNPMIKGCFKKVFVNYDGAQLINSLKQYLSQNEL